MSFNFIYYTRDEVVIHNQSDDMWVIVNGRVFDLTNLIQKRLETMNDGLRLLMQFGGKDLSWGFNEQGEPLYRVNQYADSVPVFPPILEKESEDSGYWWHGDKYQIGKITCRNRRIRIINTLTRKIIFMDVCEEDTIDTIQRKYMKMFNQSAFDYIWRRSSPSQKSPGYLFVDKTLTQNSILYERNEKLGLPPALWLFYILNRD